MGNEHVEDAGRRLDRREVPLEAVVVVDGAEGLEDDLRAGGGIAGLNRPQGDLSGGLRRGGGVGHGSPVGSPHVRRSKHLLALAPLSPPVLPAA